ncbi:F-box DNA helicase 1 isoform X2 [Nematostella vectensis]|nr:F-box DNA helicase 1 isoform X2 [Nematostella vectensis]
MAPKQSAKRRKIHSSCDASLYTTHQVQITSFFGNSKEISPGKQSNLAVKSKEERKRPRDETTVFPQKKMGDMNGKMPTSKLCWNRATNSEIETGEAIIYQSSAGFNGLPDELIENILCQLPIFDLLLRCSLVCHRWNNIIGSTKFIPMKKRYALLLHNDEQATNQINEFLISFNLIDKPQEMARNLPLNFVNFRSHNESLRRGLKSHSKYYLVRGFLKSSKEMKRTVSGDSPTLLFTSYIQSIRHSPWSVVALLTLVSSTVGDITEIINCMLGPFTNCLIIEVIECLYALASIYLELKKQNRVVSGLHYRVFYALYLFENAFSATCSALQGSSSLSGCSSGQQSIHRYRSASDSVRLTHEQVQVVKHDFKPMEVIKIIAFAGTGKTTTLVYFTKLRPAMRFLNVAYNKSIQLQAEKMFPRANVENRTIHSLAYRAVGYRYRHKMISSIKISVVSSALPRDPSNYGNTFLHAKRVVDTLTNYIASNRQTITNTDVPPRKISVQEMLDPKQKYFDSDEYIHSVTRDAAAIWERMCDPDDLEMRMTHDGYLKLYQLSNPVIDGYDCLLIDEAQDCTPAASDILLRQPCAKILVGDPYQQIYGFRGAKNAMEMVQSTRTFYLTQSFRFGPEIAYVANCILESLMGVHRKTLVGGAKPGGVFGDKVGQVAVICRTNFTLFSEAARLCRQKSNVKVGFAGGLASYNLDRILDIYKLSMGGTSGIKDPFIKRFKSLLALRQFAQNAPDPELMGKIKIVETHALIVPECVAAIRSKACSAMERADIVFSTAHKAKGLEFSTVRVTDDFSLEADFPGAEVDPDEKNLLYVAVTRAKKRLLMNRTLLRVLKTRGETFCSPCNSSAISEVSDALTECLKCHAPFTQLPDIVLERPRIILGEEITVSEGLYCWTCAVEVSPHLACLLTRPPSNEHS